MKPRTSNMSEKFFNAYENTTCSPEKTNVHSASPQSNTSVTCSRLKASPWPTTKSNASKTGQNLGRSVTYNPSSASQIFTKDLSTDTPPLRFPLPGLSAKAPPGTSHRSAEMHSISLNSPLLLPQSLLTGYPTAPLVVETDTSDYALAAILSTYMPDGELHPIAFHSRTFTSPKLNYDVHDKELLTIFEAFQRWRHYLEGSATPIDIVTDHKNLEYFSTTKLLTRRQARWSEYLSQFNLVIRFQPG